MTSPRTVSSPIMLLCILQGSNSVDLVSEDQMRSAFEIADTNGDGVLTYSEAVEVSSGTKKQSSSDEKNAVFFSFSLSSINNFIMTCAIDLYLYLYLNILL